MRIFLALASSPNPTFASNLWKWNLYDPLVDLGHDVVLWDGGIQPLFDVDPRSPECAPRRQRFGDAFLGAVEAANAAGRLDLVLTYLSDSHLEPAVIDGVRGKIAPILNFFCNNVHQFHLVERTSRHYDFCLVPEHAALAKYRRAGARPLFWPMAANPTYYHPIETPMVYDCSFAGQRYADRGSLVLTLLEAGVATDAFGQSWRPGAPEAGGEAPQGGNALQRSLALLARGRSPLRAARDTLDWRRLQQRHASHLHGPVSDDEYVRLYSSSRISLGFTIVGDTHRGLFPQRQVRLREFEATMAGAFYMTGWMDEMAMHYEVGREIVCYHSPAELVEQARWYLVHDAERERVRRAGHQRAMRDHTWQRRYLTLFAELASRRVIRGD
ncbi:MAG TPA: glycosyltransferase [Candidatus Sulfotelmatobacter sp.]|nr:glycosyltransferase [Candidatus Sulfotelmatobacter sp.]